MGLFHWLVPVSLRWIRREVREACPTLDASLVTTLMRIFTALTKHLQVRTSSTGASFLQLRNSTAQHRGQATDV